MSLGVVENKQFSFFSEGDMIEKIKKVSLLLIIGFLGGCTYVSNVSIEGKISNYPIPVNCSFRPIGGVEDEFVSSIKDDSSYKISFKVINGHVPKRIELRSDSSVVFSIELKTYLSGKERMIYLASEGGGAISDTLQVTVGAIQFKNVNISDFTQYHSK
jgi:hypothetical protein